MKKIIKILCAFLLVSFLFIQCKEASEYISIQGETMATYYQVTCKFCAAELKTELDQILQDINQSVNHYDPNSFISIVNQSESGVALNDKENLKYFLPNFNLAKQIQNKTEGIYDPTIMPIVNYWGFGYTEKKAVTKVDSFKIDSLLHYVNMDLIEITKDSITKSLQGVQLDFSSIAKGFAVDELARFLDSQNISDYLVNIGGEIASKGLNSIQKPWGLGINVPTTDARLNDAIAYVGITNKGMATSGDYRSYYEVNGVKYSHTMNPKTGYPAFSDVLSATVIAENCMTADAWATAFMAIGLENSLHLAEQEPELEALFIHSDVDGTLVMSHTDGFKEYLLP